MKTKKETLWRGLARPLTVLAALGIVTSIAGSARIHAADEHGFGKDRDDRYDDRDRRDDRHDGDHDDDGTATPIKHVVVIFQENVSFDHYFATYPKATNTDGSPFTALSGTPIVNGLFPGGLLTTNPNPALPFRLSSAEAVTCDQDHDYDDEQKAFNGRAMNRFDILNNVTGCPSYGHPQLVMGYYDGNTVTALWNYAQHFAMSDNSYGTTFGPSTPGAVNLISGQNWGALLTAGSATGNVTDPTGTPADIAAGKRSVVGDPRPDPSLDNCTLPGPRTYIEMSGQNVGDLLNEHHVTWGWFQGGFRPSGAAISGATPPPAPGACLSHHTGLSGTGTSYDYIPHHEPFQYYPQTANPKHLAPSSSTMIGRTDRANHQYDLQDFWTALDSGQLPAVSYLKAAAYQDGHAGYSDPTDEQHFVVDTINKLMESPEWAHMAIIVAYDDSDGWYDHEAGPVTHESNTQYDFLFPPVPPSATANCGGPLPLPGQRYEGRCGLGPRLPLMVISPWARQNYVDHHVTDQSSILRFIEDNWHLGRLGSQSTDAVAGSLHWMFDFDDQGTRAPRLLLNVLTGTP